MSSVATSVQGWWRELRGPAWRPDFARATRATAGFMIPLALASTIGLPVSVVFTAIAAQNIAMLDVRGDYRLRLLLLLGMTALMAAAAAIGVLATGGIGVAVAGTVIVALGAAACRHVGSDYGPSLAVAGMLLFFISLDLPAGPGALSSHVGGVLLGGAIGLGLQMALWPVRAQHPLRVVASDSWVAAAAVFEAMQPGRPPAALDDAEGGLRLAVDRATQLLGAAARHGRNPLPDRLAELSVRAARLAVRITAVRTALDGLRQSTVAARIEPSLGAVLTSLTNSARSIAVAVVSRQPQHVTTCEVRLRRLDALLESVRARLAADTADEQAMMLANLFAQSRAVVPDVLASLRACVDRVDERALFAVELFDVQTWQLKPLATALNFSRHIDATLVRFGVRLAACAALGTLIYRWWNVPHGYWIPFTVVVVMQPDYGSTRKRASQRLLGTLGGSILASILLWFAPGPALLLAGIGIGVFVFALLLKRHYASAAFAATVFVVLLLAQAGEGGPEVALARVGATLAGGLIALGAALVFWPVWEHDRFAPVLQRALTATRDYLRQLEARLQAGAGSDEATVAAKRRAEAASVALFSSVARLFADAHNPRAEMELAALLANGNQRVLRLANLIFVELPGPAGAVGSLRDQYFNALAAGLDRLADAAPALAGKPDPAPLNGAMNELDHLPFASDASTAQHAARAATEVRAMLAAVAAA